jgi:hypothetical protein
MPCQEYCSQFDPAMEPLITNAIKPDTLKTRFGEVQLAVSQGHAKKINGVGSKKCARSPFQR